MPDDFLDCVLRQAFAAATSGTTLPELRAQLRQQFGGDRYYVAKEKSLGKVLEAGRLVAAGRPPAEIAAALRVTTRHVYRLLGEKWIIR